MMLVLAGNIDVAVTVDAGKKLVAVTYWSEISM